jgi:hypothetical protein
MLHTDIEGVSDIIKLRRLAANDFHSYQCAVDQDVVILYFCSINVLYGTTIKNEVCLGTYDRCTTKNIRNTMTKERCGMPYL